jgi:hypothetical protein
MRQMRCCGCRDAFFHALAHLVRLRQACCHQELVLRGSSARRVRPEEAAAARALPPAARAALLSALLIPGTPSRCAHCGDVPDDPVATACAHMLCRCALRDNGNLCGPR